MDSADLAARNWSGADPASYIYRYCKVQVTLPPDRLMSVTIVHWNGHCSELEVTAMYKDSRRQSRTLFSLCYDYFLGPWSPDKQRIFSRPGSNVTFELVINDARRNVPFSLVIHFSLLPASASLLDVDSAGPFNGEIVFSVQFKLRRYLRASLEPIFASPPPGMPPFPPPPPPPFFSDSQVGHVVDDRSLSSFIMRNFPISRAVIIIIGNYRALSETQSALQFKEKHAARKYPHTTCANKTYKN